MATMERVKSITKEAGGDLSSHQFKFVELQSDNQLDLAGNGADATGVLLNDPDAAGKAATVAVDGVVKVICGTGGLDEGQKVASDAAGLAVVAVATDHVLGVCMKAASATELAEVLLDKQGILAA